ncbi:DUF2880 domain-containing protein [Cupriavidus necator]|uniref:DUF2880 domain-containing protein n=1 Tax=Cupriavidus necator (strain ATCC 17699 / DSM 428 / KCTC 22496 / NCIMB 10442 / H16 / Stanier 337) TaxID=381666 RepID=Q0K2Q3_CUPNH|nr:DUF2880 domain-containing protein [Cupriavidus necator]QCC03615.1 DUF2880 domain-containing protein [Cupriavidus necator H16]QQB80669.1 DUF2880 domain-containing protein [Cupriavidus necator]WKA44957.1 DUF2880 domain-containing protein [Cupriavidus necator]CAJ95721.1 conserved hypothetical protein [Cupriavidus necator H16]
MLSPLFPRSLPTALVMALSVTCASAALAAGQDEAPKPRGKDEAPEAPVACMKAVKAALPNPASFKWVSGKARKVAEDAYSVVADVEYLAQDGAVRKAKVQCDVLRAPGNQFVVPKVRLPQH